MIRSILLVILATTFMFDISCSSKKKKAEEGNVPPAAVETVPETFDINGSDSGKIPGLYTVHFEFDSSRLTPEAKRLLEKNAKWIKEKNVSVQIEGHCDKRGSAEYNLALGQRRAEAVKNYLVSLGVPAKKLTTISYGKEKLLAYGDTEADHAKNRRANFVPLK
ncbi:MAG: peptidoglycan-associated lipoprotein Pal [Bdellovibrio sp.]|nr:MAG: peptidoglycan-associated lipoprotein Pal [Bdellovibrio sp.]